MFTNKRNGTTLVWLLAVSIVLSGCASLGKTNIAKEGKEVKRCVKLAASLDAGGEEPPVNLVENGVGIFLNCYMGPERDKRIEYGESSSDEDKRNRKAELKRLKELTFSDELKLLRGHIIVHLLARYGTLNVTGEVGELIHIRFRRYRRMQQDAKDLLVSLGEAEFQLRRASARFKRSTAPGDNELEESDLPDKRVFPSLHQTYKKAYRYHRILAVADVAKQAATPAARRTLTFAATLAAATRGGAGTRAIFNDALEGFTKLAVIETFGSAYLNDARTYIQAAYGKPPIKKQHWKDWDGPLDEACRRLEKIAGIRQDCTPGNYK